jgi:hypothetical protein
MRDSHSLFITHITHLHIAIDIFRVSHLAKGTIVKLEFSWSDGYCLLSSLAPKWSRRCRHMLSVCSGPPPGFWDPNSRNPPRVAYSICVTAHSICVTAILDRPACQVLLSLARLVCPPSWLGQYGHSHVHLHLSISRCQPLRLVIRPSDLSVQASRPSFITRGLSSRHISS